LSLDADAAEPSILQRLDLAEKTEIFTASNGKTEMFVVAYTRKHKPFASGSAGGETRMGPKSGAELLTAFGKLIPSGGSFTATFVRLAAKFSKFVVGKSYLPTSEVDARRLWLERLITLAAEADAADSPVFSARSPEGPTAAVLLYEQSCNRLFWSNPKGPNKLSWSEDGAGDCVLCYQMRQISTIVGTWRAMRAASGNTAPAAAAPASTVFNPAAAAAIRDLQAEVKGLKASQAKATAKARASAPKGAPPPAMSLKATQRCKEWDENGKCAHKDECNKHKEYGAHVCAACGKNDHWLAGPNGRCPAAPK
jgi:hypothetical protein